MIICKGEKYRYLLSTDGGINYVRLKLVKNPVIKLSKQKGSYDFRASCDGIKFVYYENPGIYGSLINRIANYSTQAEKIKFKIELWENYTALTSTPYEGYVPLSALKINENHGTVEFTPVEDDKYAWWEQHKADKVDLLNTARPLNRLNTITYDVNSYTEDYYIPSDITHFIPHGFSTSCPGVTIQNWGLGNDYTGGNWQWENWVKKSSGGPYRYYCVQDHTATPDTEPGVGANWTDFWEVYTHVVYISRQVSDLPLTANGHDYIHGNGIWEPGFPSVVTADSSASNCDPFYYYYPVCSPETGTMNLVEDGAVLMSDIINYMLYGSGLTFYSQFFSDATNPITGLPNKLTELYMIHKAHIKGIADDSSKGELTLQDFIADICDFFQCFFYIDEANSYFRIEHQKYFETGSVGIDLTDLTAYPLKYQTIYDRLGGNEDENYNYLSDELPEKETFAVIDSFDYDNFIQYNSAFSKLGEIKKHQLNTFSTDFGYIIKYPTKTNDDGFCLVACDGSKSVCRRTTKMRYINALYSAFTFANYPNGDLSFDNILNDFFLQFRYFTVGTINYVAKTFTAKRIRKQGQITFPRLAAFDPYELIKTNLGNGQVSTAEIDTDTDRIKVTLLY